MQLSLFRGAALFAALVAQVVLGRPAVHQNEDTARKQDANSCLSSLKAYDSTSSASWDCAFFLDQHYVTSTVTSEETVTRYVSAHILTKNVYVVPRTAVVFPITASFVTTVTQNLAEGTLTVTNASSFARETTYTTVTARVTTTRLNPESILATATRTVGSATTTAATIATTVTELQPASTVYANPIPSRLSGCSSSEVSSACSAYLTLPIPTPYATFTTKSIYTTTVYKTTLTTTITSTVGTVASQVSITETQTYTTTIPTATTTLTFATSYINGGVRTATLSLTRKMAGTSYLTSAVPTVTTTFLVTATKTIPNVETLPAQCNPRSPNSHRWVPRSDQTFIEQEVSNIPDRAHCCSVCFSIAGCASYGWFEKEIKCFVRIVDDAGERNGWVSEKCPRGMLEGEFWEFSAGMNGLGPCWNGWWPATLGEEWK